MTRIYPHPYYWIQRIISAQIWNRFSILNPTTLFTVFHFVFDSTDSNLFWHCLENNTITHTSSEEESWSAFIPSDRLPLNLSSSRPRLFLLLSRSLEVDRRSLERKNRSLSADLPKQNITQLSYSTTRLDWVSLTKTTVQDSISQFVSPAS